MLSDQLPPVFPDEIGEEHGVEFMKDGAMYRIMRYDEDTWLIHAGGRSREDFELILTPTGNTWTLEGRNGMMHPYATGVTKGLIFAKLF